MNTTDTTDTCNKCIPLETNTDDFSSQSSLSDDDVSSLTSSQQSFDSGATSVGEKVEKDSYIVTSNCF